MNRAGIALVLATGANALAGGINIDPATRVGPVPSFPGVGLPGIVWEASVSNLQDAENFANNNDPNAFFLATFIDYPNGSPNVVNAGDTFNNMLGSDAASLNGTISNTAANAKIIDFVGFIAIERTGFYNFAVGSDDGFRLSIGNQTLTEFTGDRSFAFSFGGANFTETGLYPISLLYYANPFGESGLEFYSDLPGTRDSGTPITGGTIVDPSRLYPIPAPSALAALGLGALMIHRRRR